MSIELDDKRINKLRIINEKFQKGETQESKNRGSKKKSSLWEELTDIPFECTDIVLFEEFTNTSKPEIIVMPGNLGLFLKDIAGNDLELAAMILRYKQNTYDPILEISQRKQLIRNLILMNGLRIYVNVSRKRNTNPLKPDTETAFSNGLEKYINEVMYDRLLRDDIYGSHRFTYFPNPSGIELNKKILLGRCLLCPRNQNESSYFCVRHHGESHGSEKRTISRRINNAFNLVSNKNIQDHYEKPSLSVKAYELHNWAKNHPIHKKFRDDFVHTILKIYPCPHPNLIPWRKSIIEYKEKIELEKVYRSHFYSKELDFDLNYTDETLIDLFYSACLASEHTLIKIAGNKDLRKTYSFSDISIKEFVQVL